MVPELAGTVTSVAAVNTNLRDAFVKLADCSHAGTVERFGSITATATRAPTPLFNRAFALDFPVHEDLTDAVAWLAQREVPFWVTVTADDVRAVTALDLESPLEPIAGRQPGMVLSSLDDIPVADGSVEIKQVTNVEKFEEWVAVAASAFGMADEILYHLDPACLLADDDIRFFTGWLDGHPVATGQLIKTGPVAGVYNIGVLDDTRRHGFGEALTWHVLRTGRDLGCQTGVLQSSEMAYPLYTKMGFEPVVQYRNLEPVT